MDTTTLALRIHRAAHRYAVAAEAVDDLVRNPDPDVHLIRAHRDACLDRLTELCLDANVFPSDVVTWTRYYDGPRDRDVWLVVEVLPAHRIADLIPVHAPQPTSCPTCGSDVRCIYGPPCGERLVGGTFPNADEWHIEFALAA